MKKYSNKTLEYLENADIIYPKKSSYYMKLCNAALKDMGVSQEDIENESMVVHEQLWFDISKIVNDLAGLLLKERESSAKLIEDVRSDLRMAANQLNDYYK